MAKATEENRSLALWAADCAEHVLPYFEKECPEDDRPRKAIEACWDWARTGIFRMADIRGASLAAHAAARATEGAARFAARAAGHATATAHVPGHARAAASYAVKAVEAAGVTGEYEWQQRRRTVRD